MSASLPVLFGTTTTSSPRRSKPTWDGSAAPSLSSRGEGKQQQVVRLPLVLPLPLSAYYYERPRTEHVVFDRFSSSGGSVFGGGGQRQRVAHLDQQLHRLQQLENEELALRMRRAELIHLSPVRGEADEDDRGGGGGGESSCSPMATRFPAHSMPSLLPPPPDAGGGGGTTAAAAAPPPLRTSPPPPP